MAHHKSAKKRIRRNARANVNNKQYLSTVRTAIKKFRTAVSGAAEGKLEKATVAPLFVTAQSLLSKAAAKGLIHRNNADRKVGRLNALLKKLDSGVLATEAEAKKAPTTRRKKVTKVTKKTKKK